MTNDSSGLPDLFVTVHARTTDDSLMSKLPANSILVKNPPCSEHDIGLLAPDGASDDQSCIEQQLRLGQRLYAGRDPVPLHPDDLVLQVGRRKELSPSDLSFGEAYRSGDGFVAGRDAESRAVVSATGARLWIDDQTCQVMVMNLSGTTDVVLHSQDDSTQVRLPCRPQRRASSLRPACAAIRSKNTEITFINAGVATTFWVGLSDDFFSLEAEYVGTPDALGQHPNSSAVPSRGISRTTTRFPTEELQLEAQAGYMRDAAAAVKKAEQLRNKVQTVGGATQAGRDAYRRLAAAQVKLGREAQDDARRLLELYETALRVALCLPAHRALLREFFNDPEVAERVMSYHRERPTDGPKITREFIFQSLESDPHRVPFAIHVLVPAGLNRQVTDASGRDKTGRLTEFIFGEVPRNDRPGGSGRSNHELLTVVSNNMGITSEVLRGYLFPEPVSEHPLL